MKNKGFTLIEMVIATLIILIVSLGFFSWSVTIIHSNLATQKSNFAYSFAADVADRLQRMDDNVLNQDTTANKYVGYAPAVVGTLPVGALVGCSGGAPSVDISSGLTGMTIYTNPLNGTNQIYLYDNNNCQGNTWVDTGCGSGIALTTAANASIDHPNAAGVNGIDNYDSINPIRTFRNTTFYAVWSVAYMPCNAATNTDKRKIFVTVYWIDPEPNDTTMAAVQTNITAGTYSLKNVSATADKVIGVE